VTFTVILTDFQYAADELNGPIFGMLALAGSGLVLRGLGITRIGSGIESIALFTAISMAAPLSAVIMASSNMPLVDQWLAELDRDLFFGFNRSEVANWVASRDGLFWVTQQVYHSLIIQPYVLLAILYAAGMTGRGCRLLFAWGLTLAIILCIFPFFPATGMPPFFLEYQETFFGARDGTLRIIGRQALTGIITFPSFHAAAAVLLGWGFLRVGKLGPPMVVLNLLMFFSAIVAGHYLIDLFAGGAIAVVAIWTADKVIGSIEGPVHFTQSRPISS